MPASTRSRNKDANFKVYYSKKPLKQRFFPHRRKTVRRLEEQDAAQTVRRTEMVHDSDDESVGNVIKEEQGDTMKNRLKAVARKGKKRVSDVMQEDSQQDDDPIRENPKRRRKSATPKRRRSSVRTISAEVEVEADRSASSSEPENEYIKHVRRRQSTMTQLVESRRPLPTAVDPEFKKAKTSSRKSRGGGGSGSKKDKQQRTLTQMVPSLGSFGIVSDDDVDEDAEVMEVEGRDGMRQSLTTKNALLVDEDENEDEDEYHPTQFVRSPTAKKTRVTRRVSHQFGLDTARTPVIQSQSHTSFKSRFSLLATPEKRRILEIPSSQSPPDSPLSIRMTPHNLTRTPLKARSANASNAVETPSKRKQVTFQETAEEQEPPQRSLRTFASVIRDSEDEEEELLEDDEDGGVPIGPETQALIRNVDHAVTGQGIGTDTQAMLLSIDKACAHAEEDAAWSIRETSEELGEPVTSQQHDATGQHDENAAPPSSPSHYRSAHSGIKQEQTDGNIVSALPVPSSPRSQRERGVFPSSKSDAYSTRSSPRLLPTRPFTSMPPADNVEQDDELPSSPFFMSDDSADMEVVPVPTAPKSTHSSFRHFELEQGQRLQHEATEPVQVPRSPSSPQHDTQQSFSSKAEQQLQLESQLRFHPPASSMQVAPDTGFSYQATPFPPRQPIQHPPHSSHLSQATTIDPTQPSPKTTPRKIKAEAMTQSLASATTTPQRTQSSLPWTQTSPNQPPPLLIPSSFPSPTKVMEDWSSPVLLPGHKDDGGPAERPGGQLGAKEYSQWGGSASIDDFSIPEPPPLLPPVLGCDVEDGDEEL